MQQEQAIVEERGREKLFEHLFKKAKKKAEKYIGQALILMDKARKEEEGTTEKEVQELWMKALKKVEEAEHHAQEKLDHLKSTTKERYEQARQFPSLLTYEQAVKTAEEMKKTAIEIKQRITRSFEAAKTEFLVPSVTEIEEGGAGEAGAGAGEEVSEGSFSSLLIEYNSHMKRWREILERVNRMQGDIGDEELEEGLTEGKEARDCAFAMRERINAMCKVAEEAVYRLENNRRAHESSSQSDR